MTDGEKKNYFQKHGCLGVIGLVMLAFVALTLVLPMMLGACFHTVGGL